MSNSLASRIKSKFFNHSSHNEISNSSNKKDFNTTKYHKSNGSTYPDKIINDEVAVVSDEEEDDKGSDEEQITSNVNNFKLLGIKDIENNHDNDRTSSEYSTSSESDNGFSVNFDNVTDSYNNRCDINNPYENEKIKNDKHIKKKQELSVERTLDPKKVKQSKIQTLKKKISMPELNFISGRKSSNNALSTMLNKEESMKELKTKKSNTLLSSHTQYKYNDCNSSISSVQQFPVGIESKTTTQTAENNKKKASVLKVTNSETDLISMDPRLQQSHSRKNSDNYLLEKFPESTTHNTNLPQSKNRKLSRKGSLGKLLSNIKNNSSDVIPIRKVHSDSIESIASSVYSNSNFIISKNERSISNNIKADDANTIKRNATRGRSKTLDATESKQYRNSSPFHRKKNSSSSSLTARIVNSYSNKFAHSRSTSGGPITNGTINSKVSNSSTSSINSRGEQYKGLTSPRNSHGSLPRPKIVKSNSSSSSTSNVTRRRSSSLANTISSIVSFRGFSSFNGSKQPITDDAFQSKSTTLSDLPPVPQPLDGESYKSYLTKISPYQKLIGVILTENEDEYKQKVLKYFLENYFNFAELPLDVALRVLLIFLELPKETQQIDRLLQTFSEVYYNQHNNDSHFSGWKSDSQVYFVVFSLLILHTDYYNPNNKEKMTKKQFINLVHEDTESFGNKLPKEILSYFYDNITAQESPKFDFSKLGLGFEDGDVLGNVKEENRKNKALSSTLELHLTNSTPTLSLYSPKLILSNDLLSPSDQFPIVPSMVGRTTSNSLSNYLSYSTTSQLGNAPSAISRDDIDIYNHICNNTLLEINMEKEVNKLWDFHCINVLIFRNNYQQCSKYFSIFSELKGGYLRIHRNHFSLIAHLNYEIINESKSDFLYLKIIYMGEINELGSVKKFSLVGSNNRVSWKQEFGILTSYGLLIFDSSNWIQPRLEVDPETNISNYIIDYTYGISNLTEPIIDSNGLLAMVSMEETGPIAFQSLFAGQNTEEIEDHGSNSVFFSSYMELICKEDPDRVLYLRTPSRKFVWKCLNKKERDGWVDSINVCAAFSKSYVKFRTLNGTVISLLEISLEDRIEKLNKAKQEKIEKLKKLESQLSFYCQVIPINSKTRNELLIHLKQLAVKLEYLLYEIKRNAVYVDIAKNIDQTSSEDGDSSFYILNEIALQHCTVEKHPTKSAHNVNYPDTQFTS